MARFYQQKNDHFFRGLNDQHFEIVIILRGPFRVVFHCPKKVIDKNIYTCKGVGSHKSEGMNIRCLGCDLPIT